MQVKFFRNANSKGRIISCKQVNKQYKRDIIARSNEQQQQLSPEQMKQYEEVMKKAASDPEYRKQLEEQQKAYEEMMKNPEQKKQFEQYQKMMSDPKMQGMMQQQAQQAQSFMANPKVRERLVELKDDPEFKDFFDDVQKNGMQAMMKYMNDPAMLTKIASKLSDVMPTGAGAPGAAGNGAAAPAAAAQPAAAIPEVINLRDAAKVGDLEAMEDFIAIGKDLNDPDGEGRHPIHYAVAFGQVEALQYLLQSGANKEVRDSKGNTPVHYACGYGRVAELAALLESGASNGGTNGEGQTAFDLIKISEKNPLNTQHEILIMLDEAPAPAS